MKLQNFNEVIDAVKSYLPDYLQEHGIDCNKNFQCLNPNHEDKTPSASLINKNDSCTRVYCFSCGARYDIFDCVHYLENKPTGGIGWLQNTLKYLAEKYGVKLHMEDLSEEEEYKLNIYQAYKTAAGLISANHKDNKYLEKEIAKRSWKKDILNKYQVGTISSYEEYKNSLLESFEEDFLKEIDLLRKDIFNKENIIFTWKDNKGNPVAFIARDIEFEKKKEEAKKKNIKLNARKYNCTTTVNAKVDFFKKGDNFYGLDETIDINKPVYVFEGQADVITARHYGINNAIAISGSVFRNEHVYTLKALGIYDIILCLDGDKIGQDKTKSILENKLAGHKDLKVKVINLPEDLDPDSFIREKGVEAFDKLNKQTAFEWQLNQYGEEVDLEDICKQMIPFIVNESSPVVREKLCKILSFRTGVSVKSITSELDILLNEKAHNKHKDRESAINKLIDRLRRSPTDAELTVQEALNELNEINAKHDQDLLSHTDFLKFLDHEKIEQEESENKATGFKLGKSFEELEDVLRGEWSQGVFMCIGGKPNFGKSAWLAKLGYEIANNNKDVCVIYHTIDDTANQLAPRFVSIAEGSQKLTINMVRQPKYWCDVVGTWVKDKRNEGYNKLRELVLDGRLIVKDLSHGGNLAFTENLIQYYQNKFPDRKIIYILDNFHKLRDYDSSGDERKRFKKISEKIKSISIRKKCCILCSIEYHKFPSGVKPSDYNVGETNQIVYDANFIAHVYNEVADLPDSFTVCHKGLNWKGQEIYLPRIELIISKNKITDWKGSLFFDFYPASSDYIGVDSETVIKESEQMKLLKQGTDESEEDDSKKDNLFKGVKFG